MRTTIVFTFQKSNYCNIIKDDWLLIQSILKSSNPDSDNELRLLILPILKSFNPDSENKRK
jgi:hypothetical protein